MHPLLSAAAERQLGVFTAVDARRAGHGHEEIRVACATGAWVRLRRGVYTTPDRLLDGPGRRHVLDCVAVQLELDRPAAALSHASPPGCTASRSPRPSTRRCGSPIRAGGGRDTASGWSGPRSPRTTS